MLALNNLLGLDNGAAQIDFETAWASTNAPSKSGVFNGRTMVAKFQPGALLAGGSSVRLAFRAWPGFPISFENVYIGQAATSGHAYNFDGNQVSAVFGGSASVSIAGGESKATDPIAFTPDLSKAFLVSWYSITCNAASRLSALGTKFVTYHKAGEEPEVTLKGASYTAISGSIYELFQIEVG